MKVAAPFIRLATDLISAIVGPHCPPTLLTRLSSSRALGFEDNGEDVSIGCFTEKQKFRMKPDGDFEPEQLEKFIDGLKSGKLQPYMRSMAVPKRQHNKRNAS